MKKKVLKRVCSTAMGALIFICLPLTSFARTIDITGLSGQQYIDMGSETEDIIFTGTANSGTFVVMQVVYGSDKTITLKDLNISSTGYDPAFILTGGGNAVIELDGTNKLTSENYAGLMMVGDELVLTIKDDNGIPGSLEAKGGAAYPGIGIGAGEDATSNIVIDGGTITAIGGEAGAGIGGGYYVPATVTINGGNITAIGGILGPGIGGCDSNGTNSVVTINGGTVTAVGGESGAGIGGNAYSRGSVITISNDATVYAAGGVAGTDYGDGAAIGEGGYKLEDNLVTGSDAGLDISGLYTTGSVTTFAAGTTLEQIDTNPDGDVTVHGTLPDPNEVKEPETTKDDTNKDTPQKEQPPKKEQPAKKPAPVYTERSYIADVDVAALVAAALKADPNAKEVNIEFGDNICLTPDIMKDLFADNRVAKNCMFSHKGKRYVLRINAVDTKSKAYADGFAALKEEPDGLAGFLQMAKLFEALGVKATELDQ